MPEKLPDFTFVDFAAVMNYPEPHEMEVFDFTHGYNPHHIRSVEWGIGKYNEKRKAMYTASQFGGERNIHMGIDIWSKAGRPVFSCWDGEILYKGNNDQLGDYGPTLIAEYEVLDCTFYALYGHLSLMTLENIDAGEHVQKGQQIATIGPEEVNGGWAPHLHFQLSLEDPGQPDMPGVVAEKDQEQALQIYPDPRLVLGPLH